MRRVDVLSRCLGLSVLTGRVCLFIIHLRMSVCLYDFFLPLWTHHPFFVSHPLLFSPPLTICISGSHNFVPRVAKTLPLFFNMIFVCSIFCRCRCRCRCRCLCRVGSSLKKGKHERENMTAFKVSLAPIPHPVTMAHMRRMLVRPSVY
jgi:hypothetical protein